MISMEYNNSAEEGNPFRLDSQKVVAFQKCRTKAQPPPRRVSCTEAIVTAKKRRPKRTFPQMVHQILEDATKSGHDSVVAWVDNGTSFHIYQPSVFNDAVLPRYSKKKTKFRSFQRQLNIYGFKMTKKSGEYRHKLFRRGRLDLLAQMRPRSAPAKKKIGDRDDDDDDHTCSDIRLPRTLSLGSSDEEGFEPRANASWESHKIVSTPLLRRISLEKGNATTKRNKSNAFVKDLGIPTSCGSPDDIINCTPSNSSVHTVSLEKNRDSCIRVPGDMEFDLFDNNDVDEIILCKCQGIGCRFSSTR